MKVFYLSTCNTCKRILGEVNLPKDALLQDVKLNNISAEELDQIAQLSGSYESLFNRRSIKYRELNLKEQKLSEDDYRKYILQEYSMLKRPIFWEGEHLFAGNSKKTIQALEEYLTGK